MGNRFARNGEYRFNIYLDQEQNEALHLHSRIESISCLSLSKYESLRAQMRLSIEQLFLIKYKDGEEEGLHLVLTDGRI